MTQHSNSNGSWHQVTPSSPCPCCEHDDWCAWAPDGASLKCERSSRAPEGCGLRFIKLKDNGALFGRDDAEPSALHAQRRRTANGSPPGRDWSSIYEQLKLALPETRRKRLADELGVRWQALAELGLGWAEDGVLDDLQARWNGHRPQSAYAFAERDGSGSVVGLSLRAPDGSKSGPKGGRRGLVIPASFAQSSGVVLVVEGASDVAAARTLGLMAVGRPSNAAGAEALAELLEGRDVIVVGENDKKTNGSWPGRDGAIRVAEQLADKWKRSVRFALPPERSKDVRAWLQSRVREGLSLEDEALCDAAGNELLDLLERPAVATTPKTASRDERQSRTPVLRPFDQIPRREMEWLWLGRLPLGKLTMVAGEPGTGKSTMTMDLAARVSRGGDWPDGAPCERGAVLLLSAEDDPEDTTGPRLDAAGADGRLVLEFAGVEVESPTDGRSRDCAVEIADLVELEEILARGVTLDDGTVVPFRLVVIDPLMAYMAGSDTNRSSDVRGILRPLAKLAERARVTILVVLHPRKGDSHNALNTISGSKAFIEAVRAAWMVTKDPKDRGGPDRLFVPLKSNIFPPGTTGLRFRLEHDEGGGPNSVRVVWSDLPVTDGVEAVLAGLAEGEHTSSPRDDAREFLLELLAEGPMASSEVFEAAKAEAIAPRTLRRAFKDMGGKPRKVGLDRWEWALPTTPTEVANFDQGGQLQEEESEAAPLSDPAGLEDGHIPEDGHFTTPGHDTETESDDDSTSPEVNRG